MDRLTRPTVKIEPKPYFKQIDITKIPDKDWDLVLNGPTLMSVDKATLRVIIRKLYTRLAFYKGTAEMRQ